MRAKNYLQFLFILLVSLPGVSQDSTRNSLATKEIVYQTDNASEVYIIWAVNYWKTPGQQYWPKGTFLKNKYACTPLAKEGNKFFTSISLPYDTQLDYYFWMPKKTLTGSVDGWDTNKGGSYKTDMTANERIEFGDENLVFTSRRFSILNNGRIFLMFSFVFFVITITAFRKKPYPTRAQVALGFVLCAFLFVLLTRKEINFLSMNDVFLVFGSGFNDLLWLILLSAVFFPLLHFSGKSAILKNVVLGTFMVLLLLSVLIALLNIEVIKQLGTPFNYKWLYYSDFMKGNDAKAGAAKTLSPYFIRQLLGLLGSYVFMATAVSLVIRAASENKVSRFIVVASLTLMVAISFGAYWRYNYKPARVAAPVFAFISSIHEPSALARISTAPVSDSVSKFLNEYHQQPLQGIYNGNVKIDNILIFVSESTPSQFISLFDTLYRCTPNLEKWAAQGAVFTEMYAHIPSTPNSMISFVSGIYPMLDYRSALIEKVNIPKPSLPAALTNNGWATSLFFSSDLVYANMIEYARQQQFSSIFDFNSISCSKKFNITRSEIDGIDDSCTVEAYLDWLDKEKTTKKFSMLWTNQTHHPYFTTNDSLFTSSSKALNNYLNALHHTDMIFGKLMEGLAKRNRLSSTLVIFTADHGEAFNRHDQKLHGSRVYQENVHIPCILINPLLFSGERHTDVNGLIDIAPTIAHITGLAKPASWQGKSLLGSHVNGRTFFVSPYTDLILGSRSTQWKFIYNVDRDEVELYDLSKDPDELNNIADNHPETVLKEKEFVIGWYQYVTKKYDAWKANDTAR